MNKFALFFVQVAVFGQLNAQNRFKALGIKDNEIEYLTLSDGRYNEFHGYNDFERVGSAIIDMRTHKIVRFIDRDSIRDEGMYELDMTTRFLTIDPMAEKYPFLSPYAYCGNNPIRYVDPTGMIIEDPDELVKEQKAQLNQNLSYIQNALNGEGLSEGMSAALNKLAGAFQSSISEISTLEKSDQVYSVHYGEGKEGGVQYNNKTGAIDIGIGKGDASTGLIGHELKHAYQYEKGQISLVTDNSGYGKLYDITDETAAYNRERAFGAGIQFFQTPNAVVNGYPLQMNDNDVRSFGNSMTPPAYQTLPNGPIDINSKEGKALRQQTIEVGRTGTAVKEVYKGWQKDYLKGQKN
jgi:hypothetical protein